MVREHYQLSGHEFEQTLGGSGEQRSLLQSMGLQTVEQGLMTEQQQLYKIYCYYRIKLKLKES